MNIQRYIFEQKRGGYYSDDRTGRAATPEQYAGGMIKYGDTYTIDVHVTQPNASLNEIADAVHQKIQAEKGKALTRLFSQLQGTY